MLELRDYQQRAVDECEDWLADADDGDRRLVVAPVASGKSYIELALIDDRLDAWIVTPSIEIIHGMCDKLGIERDLDAAFEQRISTPVRLRNAIMRDMVHPLPRLIVADETHHHIESNTTTGDLAAFLPEARWIGLTATPYRGTPRATARLLDEWGEPHVVLTITDAIERGNIVLPSFDIRPLVDDDKITVKNGEFVLSAAEAFDSRLEAVCDVCREFDGRPTTLVVPTTDYVAACIEILRARGVPAFPVTCNSSRAEREEAFAGTRAGGVLVQINIVSEGVDLPWLEVLVDACPTMSPLRWMQRLGRIMRPHGENDKQYVCTNRNLERHAYLMQGHVPLKTVADAQSQFGAPSHRAAVRALGLESVGRFKQLDIPLAGGAQAFCYALYSTDSASGVVTEFFVLGLPHQPQPLVAQRQVAPPGSRRRYGKWQRVAGLPDDFAGFATSRWNHGLSDKQRAWWQRSAGAFGLDADAHETITAREFAVLPVLCDLKLKVG